MLVEKIAASSKYYIPIIKCRKRYMLLYGGRSSAKSDQAAQKMIILCRTEKNFKGVCLRKIYADIKDSQFDTMWDVITRNGWEDEFVYTKSPLEMRHCSGRKILARGLDKPAKLKSITNPTVVWAEEADELKLDDFIKSDTSIRHPDPSTLLQFIFTFNPENEGGWINDYFFPHKSEYEDPEGNHTFVKSKIADTVIMHSTYKHNDYTTEGNRAVIKNLARLGVDSNYYRVYVLGLWGSALRGLVFENVRFRDNFPKIEDCKKYGIGLDFGFTNDPTAIMECALAHGELWFRELTHKTGLVNIKEENSKDSGASGSIVGELERNGVSKRVKIIADCAEPKSIASIKGKGYNIVGVKKGKDSIEGALMQMKGYVINIVGSPNLKKEVKSYRYAENKEGELTNEPIDAWNHCVDGIRYWFMENIMTRGKKFSLR